MNMQETHRSGDSDQRLCHSLLPIRMSTSVTREDASKKLFPVEKTENLQLSTVETGIESVA